MKLLKALTIVLFSLSLCFSVSFAQENTATEAVVDNQQNDSNSGAEVEKTVPVEKTEAVKLPDPVIKKKNSVNENKNDSRTSGTKKNSEKKNTPVSAEVKEDAVSQVKLEGDLLPINEGNFKYNRIPDIKLVDVKPQTSENNIQVAEVSKSAANTSAGFLGLSKTASDVIVKGGALLLILLIFVLYKSRMSHPGSKSSKKRNVLNSYRK